MKEKTNGGSLTGYIWLYYVARPRLADKTKIIIYSEFINELIDYNDDDCYNAEENDFLHGVITISKTDAVNNPKNLLEAINDIFKKKKQS